MLACTDELSTGDAGTLMGASAAQLLYANVLLNFHGCWCQNSIRILAR